MKTDGKYLSFHIKCLERGMLPGGLCHNYDAPLVPTDPIFELFIPTESELYELQRDGYSRVWWASGHVDSNMKGVYTPLRQTIVLFMAAINGEL